MILEREQIQRYMRHIIMPEIGGPGQKKLLDSSVLVYCESISRAAVMLYYLSAMGIGKIDCFAGNIDDIDLISQNAKGLNPDLQLRIADVSCCRNSEQTAAHDVIINFYEKAVSSSRTIVTDAPVIYAAVTGDCGYLRTVRTKESISQAIDEINSLYTATADYEYFTVFSKAYGSFSCTLTAIEAVKVLLGIGSLSEHPLQYDLSTYNFTYDPVSCVKKEYSIKSESAKEKLGKAKVLIIGSGGLGSPAAYTLALSGIGKLGLVDFDTVEISNLNRQILHSTDTIGMPKVKSAEIFLKKLDSNVEICTYNEKFALENAEALIADYDIVIGGLDNLPNRYLLNDICYFLKKPWLEAGVLRFDGLTTTIIPDISICYRCIFPEVQDRGSSVPSCSETGVLGAVPGVMGMLQAIEAIKHLTGVGATLVNKLLIFDALNTDFTLVDIDRSPHCELCGTDPTIKAAKDYEFVCENK